MSLSEILSSALSGLGAAQAGLRSVSNNVANVNTPGYARERTSQEAGVLGGKVSGVVVGEPTRIADKFLEAAVYTRSGDAGRSDVTNTYTDRMQALFGATGSETALPARLDAVASAATAMTGTTAGGTQTNAAFIGQVSDALVTMQSVRTDLGQLRADADGEISSTVDRVNTLLRNVSDYNDTIAQADGLGRSSAGTTDKRTAALSELSGLIGIVTREQPDGRISIDTQNGTTLLDRKLRQLSYPNGGIGTDQPSYPTIEVKYADANGQMGASTGARIDTAAVGGKIGGLLDLRDTQVPALTEKLGTLFGGLAQTLNAASNAGTAVPAPATLTGRTTPLTAADRLGFTGAATFAVTAADGTLVKQVKVDFDALGSGATMTDALDAINTGLAGAGTATLSDGKLSIAASGSGNGIVVAQDATKPSSRAGVGFSQYFGLNDLVVSSGATLVPSGFSASDASGFAAGQKVDLTLRDTNGRTLATTSLDAGSGSTFGDLVTSLQSSSLGGYGTFSLDSAGRLRFAPTDGNAGAALSVAGDGTARAGSGLSFSAILGLNGDSNRLASGEVRRDIVADPTKLPLAQLQTVAVGQKALGTGDRRGASTFADAMASTIDLGKDGTVTVTSLTTRILGDVGTAASRAKERADETAARRDDAVSRRDSFSGVNIDEELGQMVVLQNSYSASARVMSAASQMYDTLLGMVR